MEHRIGMEIRVLSKYMGRYLDDIHGIDCMLSGPQGLILIYLCENDEEVYQKDIEKYFNIRRSTATGLLNSLEKNGYITKEPVENDKRMKKIKATEHAYSTVEKIDNHVIQLEKIMLDGIDENGNISKDAEEAVMNELRAGFRPEFLNRLDEIILFKPLTKSNIGEIIHLLMEDLNSRLVDKEVRVELSKEAEAYVVDHGFDPVYGARPMKRYLQKTVETEAAKLILADRVRAGDTILIDVENGALTAKVKA